MAVAYELECLMPSVNLSRTSLVLDQNYPVLKPSILSPMILGHTTATYTIWQSLNAASVMQRNFHRQTWQREPLHNFNKIRLEPVLTPGVHH